MTMIQLNATRDLKNGSGTYYRYQGRAAIFGNGCKVLTYCFVCIVDVDVCACIFEHVIYSIVSCVPAYIHNMYAFVLSCV